MKLMNDTDNNIDDKKSETSNLKLICSLDKIDLKKKLITKQSLSNIPELSTSNQIDPDDHKNTLNDFVQSDKIEATDNNSNG